MAVIVASFGSVLIEEVDAHRKPPFRAPFRPPVASLPG